LAGLSLLNVSVLTAVLKWDYKIAISSEEFITIIKLLIIH
jgi:hypothetical protein